MITKKNAEMMMVAAVAILVIATAILCLTGTTYTTEVTTNFLENCKIDCDIYTYIHGTNNAACKEFCDSAAKGNFG